MNAHDSTERAAAVLRSADVGGDPDRDDAMIRAALLAGRGRHRAHQRRRVIAAAAIGGALAASIALWLWLPEAAPPEAGLAAQALTSLTIEDDHRLVATREARFEVDRRGHLRVVRLDAGAMLFDVAPISRGEGFEVHTPSARVIVTGTVFAVEVLERGVVVEVFEGRVRIEKRGGAHELGAGESYAPDGEGRAIVLLRERGREAARRRGVEPTEVAVVEAPPHEDGGDEEPVRVDRGRRGRADRVASDAPVRARRPAPRTGAPAEAAITLARESLRSAALPARVIAITPEHARALILEGRGADALELARARAGDPEWRFVEGDALRSLSRPREAAQAYDDAARALPRRGRVEAAFLAARLRMSELSDAAGALASLDAGAVDALGSPLRERALALRADALAHLGRAGELREVAREYVRDFPLGSHAPRLARVAEAPPAAR